MDFNNFLNNTIRFFRGLSRDIPTETLEVVVPSPPPSPPPPPPPPPCHHDHHGSEEEKQEEMVVDSSVSNGNKGKGEDRAIVIGQIDPIAIGQVNDNNNIELTIPEQGKEVTRPRVYWSDEKEEEGGIDMEQMASIKQRQARNKKKYQGKLQGKPIEQWNSEPGTEEPPKLSRLIIKHAIAAGKIDEKNGVVITGWHDNDDEEEEEEPPVDMDVDSAEEQSKDEQQSNNEQQQSAPRPTTRKLRRVPFFGPASNRPTNDNRATLIERRERQIGWANEEEYKPDIPTTPDRKAALMNKLGKALGIRVRAANANNNNDNTNNWAHHYPQPTVVPPQDQSPVRPLARSRIPSLKKGDVIDIKIWDDTDGCHYARCEVLEFHRRRSSIKTYNFETRERQELNLEELTYHQANTMNYWSTGNPAHPSPRDKDQMKLYNESKRGDRFVAKFADLDPVVGSMVRKGHGNMVIVYDEYDGEKNKMITHKISGGGEAKPSVRGEVHFNVPIYKKVLVTPMRGYGVFRLEAKQVLDKNICFFVDTAYNNNMPVGWALKFQQQYYISFLVKPKSEGEKKKVEEIGVKQGDILLANEGGTNLASVSFLDRAKIGTTRAEYVYVLRNTDKYKLHVTSNDKNPKKI